MKIAILATDNREMSKRYDLPEPYFGTAPEALLQGFEMLDGIEVHVISCLRQPVKASEKIGRNLWYHSLVVPKIGWMSTGYQGCIRAVRKKLAEIKPDIVHGQGTERDCAMNAVFSGYPNVLTIHGNMVKIAELQKARPFSFYWLAGQFETLALSRTSGVLCNSAYTESVVKPRANRTWRVANPLRSSFFAPQAPPRSTKPERPTIINVGVVGARKQQVELLDLAHALHCEGHAIQFIFVGSVNPESEYGRTFLDKIEIARKAGYGKYLGVKNTSELIDLFDTSTAMVHFPLEEAFGLVAAEGLARNLKFFGSDAGGIVEITQGADLAELHPVQDYSSLKRGILEWLKKGHPKPTQASVEMTNRYHPKIIAQEHVKIYSEVLSQAV
jgi:glycosyltransferase involved in cell wall biosynthesis